MSPVATARSESRTRPSFVTTEASGVVGIVIRFFSVRDRACPQGKDRRSQKKSAESREYGRQCFRIAHDDEAHLVASQRHFLFGSKAELEALL
jgi:hypothetical protein